MPGQEQGIQCDQGTCLRQEAAPLPGTAALTALVSLGCLCHCAWLPGWDLSLQQLSQHTWQKKKPIQTRSYWCCVGRTPQSEKHWWVFKYQQRRVKNYQWLMRCLCPFLQDGKMGTSIFPSLWWVSAATIALESKSSLGNELLPIHGVLQ